MIENCIIIAVLAIILTASFAYVVMMKKRSGHCMGCPYSKQCGGNCTQNKPRENDENAPARCDGSCGYCKECPTCGQKRASHSKNADKSGKNSAKKTKNSRKS